MRGRAGFFDVDERLKEISAKGDDLERLTAIVDFEAFRPDPARAVPRSDGSKGGRPPFDHVFMWKVPVLQASHSLSDERTEFLIKDRLSFMRFLGLGLSDIAVPAFGYKNHVGIDRRHGLIRTWTATHAARHDGAQLPNLISKANTASTVWADTAYRSKVNEQHLADSGLRSQIHRKKPAGRPRAKNVARANNARSKVRAGVEHVFARQKGPMALVVRTIGLARATVKIGLANIAYNMRGAAWLTAQRQAKA